MKGILYLIPAPLGDDSPEGYLPPAIAELTREITFYIVEDIRTARRFLRKINPSINIDGLTFMTLNEHTKPDEISALIEPLMDGHNTGLLSEAGLPCIADPGSQVVALAHENDIRIVPVPGPSSIFLALMASGFNGQNFTFHGYLPVEKHERVKKIKELETMVYQKNQTQVFIETPYRNQQMMESLITACKPHTKICVATGLTLPGENIRTLSAGQWKKTGWNDLNKKPAVFLMFC